MNPFPNEPRREVDVWHVRLSSPADVSLLSLDERARADRFRFDRDRDRFIACRSALRIILGGHLAVVPEAIIFAYGPHGKPYLPESKIKFNVSHSGDEALIAVAIGREVGIDVEQRDRQLSVELLAADYLTDSERVFFNNHPECDRRLAFVRCWTRKEAWSKAVGTGIAQDPERYDVGEFVALPVHSCHDPKTDMPWAFIELDFAPEWIGALVVQGMQISVKFHEFARC